MELQCVAPVLFSFLTLEEQHHLWELGFSNYYVQGDSVNLSGYDYYMDYIAQYLDHTLTKLDLSHTQVNTEDLSRVMSRQHNLKELILQRTNIKLMFTSDLCKLDLTEARCDGTGIHRLNNLQVLNASRTHFSQDGLNEVATLTRLHTIAIMVNHGLSFTIPPHFDLRCLTLRYYVTDTTLAPLRYLTNLEYLDLNSCEVSTAGLTVLKHLPHLRVLDVSNNDIDETNLVGLSNLHYLNVVQTHVNLPRLTSLTHLLGLSIGTVDQDNECVDISFVHHLTTLRHFQINRVRISGDCRLPPHLATLTFAFCIIPDSLFDVIGGMALTLLSLESCVYDTSRLAQLT